MLRTFFLSGNDVMASYWNLASLDYTSNPNPETGEEKEKRTAVFSERKSYFLNEKERL